MSTMPAEMEGLTNLRALGTFGMPIMQTCLLRWKDPNLCTGALERYMTTRSDLGIYYNVAVTAQYRRQRAENLKAVLFSALSAVIPQHPSLSAIPVNTNTTSPFFVRLPHIDLHQVVEFIDISQCWSLASQGNSPALDGFIQEQHNRPFEYTKPLSPFWRLYVIEDPTDTSHFTLSFFFHHCIADTQSALVFHEAIESAMNAVTREQPTNLIKSSASPLLPPLDDLLNHVSPMNSKGDQGQPPGEWAGAKQFIPVRSRFCSYCLPAETTEQLVNAAKQKRVSVTASLQAMLVAAIFGLLPEDCTTVRADCAVSLRPWLPVPISATSMGCFIDNFGTSYSRCPFSWNEARKTKRAIDQIVQRKGGENLCGRLAQISDLKPWLQSKRGKARPSALELSNVGKLSPTGKPRDYEINTLLFSQCAGACSGAIKVSVATGRDKRLTLGFSWQEGVVEDDMIGRLIRQFRGLLEEALSTDFLIE